MAVFCTVQSLNKKKLKWRHTVAFVFAYLVRSNTDSRHSYANKTIRCYKKSHGGNGNQLKEGVLHGQTCATGLSESVTLLKSTFKLQKQNFIEYHSSKVTSHPDCIFEIHQW